MPADFALDEPQRSSGSILFEASGLGQTDAGRPGLPPRGEVSDSGLDQVDVDRQLPGLAFAEGDTDLVVQPGQVLIPGLEGQ